jgi:hypothetical protein
VEEPVSAGPLPVAAVTTWDPQGSGAAGENDELAPLAADGDPGSAWRTERYDQATFFGSKTGVGLVLRLEGPARLDSLRIDSPSRGWDASVFVLDGAVDDDGTPTVDPSTASPDARVADAPGTVEVDLGGATGDAVLVWITDLGEAVDGGGHRVELAEATLVGTPAT